MRDEQEGDGAQRAVAVGMALAHLADQVLEDAVIEAVDLTVPTGHLSGVDLVLLDQGFEDVVHLPDRQLAHQSELGSQRVVGQRDESAGHASDAHGVVAHALELGGDVLNPHQMTQVARHRLLGRDDHENLLADLPEELVQVLVLGADLFRRRAVATPQRVQRRLDL